MLRFHKEGVDVIEPAIRSFSDQWAGPALKDPAMCHLPLNNRVAHHANTMRVCNPNRTFQKAAFFHPCRACHLTVPVEGEPGCEDRVMDFRTTWVNNGDPGSG